MSRPELLRDREKALEDQFFAKENARVLARMREQRDRVAAGEALRLVSGIHDEALIDRLVEAGVVPETWAAVALVPLVEVAWASGRLEASERAAVRATAEANGVAPGTPAHELLLSWLEQRPAPELFAAWGEYTVMATATLTPQERAAMREIVVGRAKSVVEGTRGLLGFLTKPSPDEQRVLDELDAAFSG